MVTDTKIVSRGGKRRRRRLPGPNMVDRAVAIFAPRAAARRLQARQVFHLREQFATAGRLEGGKTARRVFESWLPRGGSANDDTLDNLERVRDRSRDLAYNTPLATGTIGGNVDNIVGRGLMPQPRLKRKLLGLAPEQAGELEAAMAEEFALWAENRNCDAGRRLNFALLQAQALRATLEGGDVFGVRLFLERPGAIYASALQLVEAERCRNRDNKADTKSLAGGIEVDPDTGAPRAYHFASDYDHAGTTWQVVPAFDSAGYPNVFHLFDQRRPGQVRGVPYLHPAFECLKQLDRYTEAELMAAVINAVFAVAMESEDGEATEGLEAGTLPEVRDLHPGLIFDLAEGDDVRSFTPGRPSATFEPFFLAIVRQIAVGLELPYEIVIKHFTASYSASRAAIEQAWRFYLNRRAWLAHSFCQPAYEAVLREAVARGRLRLPGFFRDPAIRAAYCHCEWIGPARLQIDEVKEVTAAEKRIELKLSTRQREAATLMGSDWEQAILPQVARERRLLEAEGLGGPAAALPRADQEDQEDQAPDQVERADQEDQAPSDGEDQEEDTGT